MNDAVMERDIVQAIESYFVDRGMYVVTELPFLQRRVDLVAYSPSSSAVQAVEAKVKNWRAAVKQAISCLLFADEVYIALPEEFVHRVEAGVVQEFGLGLIEVNSKIEILIPATRSPYNTAHHRKRVRNYIRDRWARARGSHAKL